jgi:ubiquitin thioesterase protein OTUB1
MKKYKYIRRTRGDGNCFYRAFGFGYLEKNLPNEPELDRFRQLTYDLKDQLVKLGYLEFTVEDLRDVIVEIIDNIRKGGNEASLKETFCASSYSDYFGFVLFSLWIFSIENFIDYLHQRIFK